MTAPVEPQFWGRDELGGGCALLGAAAPCGPLSNDHHRHLLTTVRSLLTQCHAESGQFLFAEGGKKQTGGDTGHLERRGMAGHQHLLCAALLGLLFTGIITVAGSPATDPGITLELDGDRVTLHCNIASVTANWSKDGHQLLGEAAKDLHLGTAPDDPRGFYECIAEQGRKASLQVFFRMCQNCIHMDFATVSGLLVASVVTTVFLALAVSKIAAQEPGRLSRASDKQTLLTSDQLYQPLGERNNGQYSQIGIAKPRHR